MLVHVSPPSREMLTNPSSEPAQNTPASCADSTNANIVQYVSAPEVSKVTGPPEGCILVGSLRVKSGLIGSQELP